MSYLRADTVTVHRPIYLVFHPTQTSHFAALAIIFRNSWGNSQATSETIYCLIGKWSLGNEICWCPATHPLPFILKVFHFGLPHVWLFIWIVKTKEICVFLLKLLPSLNSCSYRSQSSLHMVSVLLICTLRPSVWVHKCFSISFLLPCLHSCSFLCCSSLTPPFHHCCCWSSSVSHCWGTAVTHRISASFPQKLKRNVWAQEGSMCVGGGCKISPVLYFSQEDLSLFYAFGTLPSACTPVMYPSGGTLSKSP